MATEKRTKSHSYLHSDMVKNLNAQEKGLIESADGNEALYANEMPVPRATTPYSLPFVFDPEE